MQVIAISALLNAKLDDLFRGTRLWFQLFSHMDDDKSGRISFKEALGMIREELKLGASALPEADVERVWRVGVAW